MLINDIFSLLALNGLPCLALTNSWEIFPSLTNIVKSDCIQSDRCDYGAAQKCSIAGSKYAVDSAFSNVATQQNQGCDEATLLCVIRDASP
ncbi:MAG TPA: hypothetical protein PL193_04945 [Xanthobacteraceae bacterium]|nr:hypothetical protein [Xanthobacteraceae bacterium]